MIFFKLFLKFIHELGDNIKTFEIARDMLFTIEKIKCVKDSIAFFIAIVCVRKSSIYFINFTWEYALKVGKNLPLNIKKQEEAQVN